MKPKSSKRISVYNRMLYSLYHIFFLVAVIFTLNDYGYIKISEKNGMLEDIGDGTLNLINSTKITKEPPSKDVKVVILEDSDISEFPGQMSRKYDLLYLKSLNTESDVKYIDDYTKKEETLYYEDVIYEYCTSIHADASASRYGIVTAIKNIKKMKNPPELILLDFIFIGRSTKCHEYDDELADMIKNDPSIIVIASAQKEGNAKNSLTSNSSEEIIQGTTKTKETLESSIYSDQLIYPYFKNIYIKNEDLDNIGLGNIYIEENPITKGLMYKTTKNYKIPTVSNVIEKKLNGEFKEDKEVVINWRSSFYEYFNLSSIVMPINELDIKSKVIIFGSNRIGKSEDKAYTPIQDSPTPGVYIQANMIDNIINKDFIKLSERIYSFILTIFFISLVYISFFGNLVSKIPNKFMFSEFFRNQLLVSAHKILSKKIATLGTFFAIEMVFILVVWIVFYTSNMYVDIVSPVIVGSIFYSAMQVMDYIVTRVLFGNLLILEEYRQKGKLLYFIKRDSSEKYSDFIKNIESSFEKSIVVSEYHPFNSGDIFGFQTVSKYYWISTNLMITKDIGYQYFKTEIVKDRQEFGSILRDRMSVFWKN